MSNCIYINLLNNPFHVAGSFCFFNKFFKRVFISCLYLADSAWVVELVSFIPDIYPGLIKDGVKNIFLNEKP